MIRYLIVPVEKLQNPDRGGYFEHHLNAWWKYVPDMGVVFSTTNRGSKSVSPQCNTDKLITYMLDKKFPMPCLETSLLLVASAWVPTDHEGSCWLPKEWVFRTVEV